MDVTKEFNLNLDVHINIEGKTTSIPLLVDIKVPIPLCNNDFSLYDLGVGSIKELVDTLQQNVSNAGVDWVLEMLGIKVRPKINIHYQQIFKTFTSLTIFSTNKQCLFPPKIPMRVGQWVYVCVWVGWWSYSIVRYVG